MIQPLILDTLRLTNRSTAQQLRRDLICRSFGQLSMLSELPSLPPIQAAARELPGGLISTWRSCIAAELLLRHNAGKAIPTEWRETFADAAPLFNDSKLSDMLDTATACCMFPLANPKGPSSCGIAWVQQGTVPVLVADVERQDWNGDSWQLAAALARQALDSGSSEIIQKLATDWIATGTCEGNRIGPVELGNKLELDTRRNWIIPATLTPPETKPHGQIFRAATIQSAFNIVAGHG